jgi:hypothetical protein
MCADVSPRWLPLSAEGGFSNFKLWVHRHAGPTALSVKWDLRRLLDELKGSPVRAWNVIKDEKSAWEQSFGKLKATYSEVVVPSITSLRAQDRNCIIPAGTIDEYQIESLGMFGIILHWAVRRKKASDRDRAAKLLRTFLQAVLADVADPIHEMALLNMSDETRAACEVCSAAGGDPPDTCPCTHLRQATANSLNQEDPVAVVSDLLVQSFMLGQSCDACCAQLRAQLDKLALHISSCGDAIGTSDPLGADVQLRDASKRRLDSDKKGFLVEMAVKHKRARTVGMLAKARCEPGSENASRWMLQNLGAYRLSLRLEFNEVQHLALAFDASRVGQPREETLIVAAINLDKGVAGWLCPQAPYLMYML